MSAKPVPYLTVEQYLEIEEKAEYKSEYFDGVMWPLGGEPHGMAGGRMAHGFIAVNMTIAIGTALRGRCRVMNSDTRVRVGLYGLYTYPDVSVVCGKPETVDDTMTLLNPTMIVEVLSKTTEALDRGFKFIQYRCIPELREYILVSQVEPKVEVFRRTGADGWTLATYSGLDSVARFEAVDCSIPLADIFLEVQFS